MSELRKRSRVPAQFQATMTLAETTFPIVTRNVSLKGMLCDPDPKAVVDSACRIELSLASDIVLSIQGKVVRNEESGLAVDFTGMDEQTFLHLRNIVRYGSGDADCIDQELAVPAFTPE